MATKEQIINNLREYSASEIVHAIKCGEVSMYELSKSGKLTPLMKKRIEEQLADESVEVNPPSSEMDNTEETIDNILPSASEDVEVQPLAVESIQTETPPAPVIPSAVSSQNENTEFSVLDNKGMFKRIFSFKGRIRRTEYGLSYIIFLIWYLIFMSVTEMNDVTPVLALLIILTIVPAYWFLWAQGAKRCHDRGNSGWYQIIPFYFLIMLFGGSEDGINDYGTNPKE
ncbi:DUF805 domain-containing protein [uncultured Muribaculum sp.]|uniref:DUF805 domain-containing protein n=1 Tax=uncultured Muribaculum sp. TaxID=1918613 RepID=UPI0025B74A4A|nr:DUF805 domain-containing protein [uncultured Muribaculum sp.]